MFVVGLTGGIGSGKSLVAKAFATLGVSIVDSDVIARECVKKGTPALAEIVKHFGADILDAEGNLDRALLKQKIFADAKDRVWLEQLLHPLIRANMKTQIEQSHSSYVIAVIPLLFETERRNFIQRTLVVDAPEELQIERVKARDSLNEEAIKKIMQTQISRQERLGLADDVIINDNDFLHIEQQVKKLHQFYLELAR